jgi:hypothetical protein
MSEFISNVVADLRHGRQSWRVYLTLWAPSCAAAVVVAVTR